MVMADRPKTITSLDEITGNYAAILCDVWGVLHNGVSYFEAAAEALAAARARGVAVVMITNSPRPHEGVVAQFQTIGVPDAAWDRVVTSGDVTRDLISAGSRRIFHLGPERDGALFDGLDVELAEEFVLTNAELSFLQERRQAYENLANRTGLDTVKAVAQALIQAERYGTPVAHALRVLASESRDQRMNAAEKKAAALPPKLTVPMILFFLPVLFIVILGPAAIRVMEIR